MDAIISDERLGRLILQDGRDVAAILVDEGLAPLFEGLQVRGSRGKRATPPALVRVNAPSMWMCDDKSLVFPSSRQQR